MSIMKPLGAAWLAGAYNYIKEKDSMVKKGFKAAGLIEFCRLVFITTSYMGVHISIATMHAIVQLDCT